VDQEINPGWAEQKGERKLAKGRERRRKTNATALGPQLAEKVGAATKQNTKGRIACIGLYWQSSYAWKYESLQQNSFDRTHAVK
jgi:hypothetical protein